MFKDFKIIPFKSIKNLAIRYFLIKNHYKKHSMPRACSRNYALVVDGELRGVAFYGHPTSPKYNNKGYIELKRFALDKDCPKNTGSWFMSKCHKELKREYDKVITYADQEQGHEGTLYKASNFTFLGHQPKKGQAIQYGNQLHHLRNSYQKINGSYTKFALEIKEALKTKKAKYVYLKPKLIFEYKLK